MVAIYALVDPRDDSIRYIGQTRNFDWRMYIHRTEHVSYDVAVWKHELKDLGLKFRVRVIEITSTDNGLSREEFWIIWALRRGEPILNKWRRELLQYLASQQ